MSSATILVVASWVILAPICAMDFTYVNGINPDTRCCEQRVVRDVGGDQAPKDWAPCVCPTCFDGGCTDGTSFSSNGDLALSVCGGEPQTIDLTCGVP